MTFDHIHIFCLQMPYLGVVHPPCNCILIGICTLEISGVWGWIMYKINVNVKESWGTHTHTHTHTDTDTHKHKHTNTQTHINTVPDVCWWGSLSGVNCN